MAMNLQIRPDEISDILKRQILEAERTMDVYESGTVLQVGDGVARVHGLANVQASELVAFPDRYYGDGAEPGRGQCGVCAVRRRYPYQGGR